VLALGHLNLYNSIIHHKTNFKIMFDYKIIAYNKLGKVQETENLYCTPDEIDDVMYTMSEQYGYAEA